MYEKVWSGDVDGYEISLDFIEHRGLFRYTAKKDGVLISDRLCADPMDAGLMDGPGIMSNFTTPFVPSTSEIRFEGRFAPFHTPEEINFRSHRLLEAPERHVRRSRQLAKGGI